MAIELFSVVSDRCGNRVVEVAPGCRVVCAASEVAVLLEACLGQGADLLLLWAENLPEDFFDLSSGQAGVILQKLRNYGIRTAVVVSPETRPSHRFKELVEEESRGPHFRLFDAREAALAWLASR